MSERAKSRSVPHFDRPLQRLAWIIPASLLLWILILAGFSFLLGNLPSPPYVPPVEVSLADLGSGAPGGSPGGAGAPGDGSGGRAEAPGPILPAPTLSAPEHAVVAGRPVVALERRPVPVATRLRKKPIPKRPLKTHEVAATTLAAPPVHESSEEIDVETAVQPQRRERAPTALISSPPLAAPESKAAQPARGDVANIGRPAAGGGGGDFGSGSGGSAGNGSGGEGMGSGGGIGEGTQVFATVDHPPVPISTVLPIYPGAARAQGVEGEVVLRAIVDRHGSVEREIVVVESVPMLDRAAVAALRQWRFEPGRDAGNRAVRVVIEVPLRFRLR